MADDVVFQKYEQHKNIGKINCSKRYSSACKDIEKKLVSLYKRIGDLQNKRTSAYKNTLRIKKKIHNQTNQIVKCFRERERDLLLDVDEAYMAQDSTFGTELTKLTATHARCHALYKHLENFKEGAGIVPEIEKILSSFNFAEKTTFKPLEFSSNFEQTKADAGNYGILTGEFVGRSVLTEEGINSPIKVCNNIKNNETDKQCCSEVNTLVDPNKKLCPDFQENIEKRERTDSQDSFEIVEMLENIHCEEDKECLDAKESSDNNMSTDKFETSNQFTKCAKYPEMEKQLNNLQQRLENLVTSSPKLTEEFNAQAIKSPENQLKKVHFVEKTNMYSDGWLHKSCPNVTVQFQGGARSKFDAHQADSAANLIRKAFSPYFKNENPNKWLYK